MAAPLLILQPFLSRHYRWLFWLLAMAVIFSGIGLREPWPGDEPRFAQVAREMVQSGQWFFPTRGGELYADKPPLFMWAIAVFYAALGSIRWAFLLPSACSGLLTLWLVKDLGQRLWNQRTGYIAAGLLLLTLQFVLKAKSAQIDAMVCGWITLGCYGLLRHLLGPPQWRWYYLGWFFMGLGVITKGVGFLPALMLIPYALARRVAPLESDISGGWRWWLGPVFLLAAIALWLVPMLILVDQAHDPAFTHYRDNILFTQTARRYAHSWHHLQPFWFYFTSVIPVYWLPLSLMLPWLLAPWRHAIKNGDRRIILPLAWILLLLLFFSVSKGKRDVYILPALPMLALIAAPFIETLWRKSVLHHVLAGVVWCLTLFCLATGVAGLAQVPVILALVNQAQVAPWWLLLAIGSTGVIALAVAFNQRHNGLSWALFIPCAWLLYCGWGYPLLQPGKSAQPIFTRMAPYLNPAAELAIIDVKEQLLLESPYPVTHFGFFMSAPQQVGTAWHWLTNNNRFLLIYSDSAPAISHCFSLDHAIDLGEALRKHWWLLNANSRLNDCPYAEQSVPAFRFQAR